MVLKIATGEIVDKPAVRTKRTKSGKAGGIARGKALSSEGLKETAQEGRSRSLENEVETPKPETGKPARGGHGGLASVIDGPFDGSPSGPLRGCAGDCTARAEEPLRDRLISTLFGG
jgi:hypothetical protein